MPGALLPDRLLALQAAEACARFLGQAERAAEIRDEVHLLRLDGRPGRAGAIFDLWRKAPQVRVDCDCDCTERLGDQFFGEPLRERRGYDWVSHSRSTTQLRVGKVGNSSSFNRHAGLLLSSGPAAAPLTRGSRYCLATHAIFDSKDIAAIYARAAFTLLKVNGSQNR